MPGLVRLDRSQVQFNKAVMWFKFIWGVSHEMMKRISLRLCRDKSPSLQVLFLKGKAVLARLLISMSNLPAI